MKEFTTEAEEAEEAVHDVELSTSTVAETSTSKACVL